MSPRRVSTLDLAPRRAPARPSAREAIGTVVEVRGDVVAVDLGDGAASPLRATPGGYVVGAPVRVALDADRAPISVLGPARDAREGERVDVVMPGLLPTGPAELSEEDRQRYEDAVSAIREAREEIGALGGSLDELDEHLAVLAQTLPIFSRWQPEGTHPQGTIWYQLNTSGQVTGVWEQAGPGDGTNWQGRPLTSTAVVSLTAAQITAGTGAFQTAVAQKIWAEVITAARVSANRGVFRDLVAEHVNVASSSGGRGVRITDAGLVLVGADGSAAVDLTTAATTYLSILSGGQRVAGISSAGAVTGVRAEFRDDVVVAGQSVVEALDGAGGRSLGKSQLISRVAVPPDTYQGLLEKSFTVPRSGHRQIVIKGRVDLGGAPASWVVAGLHFSTNAYTTTANDRRHAEALNVYPDRRGGGRIEYEVNTEELGVSPGSTVRVLMSLQTNAQGVFVEPGTGTYLSFADLGPAVPTARTIIETAAPITRAPERTTSRYWVQVPAASFQSYRADGSPISKTGSDVGARFAVQGYNAQGGGMKWSLIEFDYARLAAAVQGATILHAEAHLNAAHWFNGSGTAVVGVHGPIPPSLPSSQIGAWGLKTVRIDAGKWGHVRFDANVHAGLQSLQTRSISLFTTNSAAEFYGYLHAGACYLNLYVEK